MRQSAALSAPLSTALPTAAALRRAVLLIGVVTLAWAAIEALGAIVPDHPSAYQVVWMRYATHLLVLLLFFGPRYRSKLWRTQRPLLQIGRGLLMLGMPVAFILSIRRLSVGSTWSVFWLAPMLALALAALALHEKTGWAAWLASIAAYAGALILLRPDPSLLSPAVVLPLGMSLCFALYVVGCRVLRSENILASLFYTGLVVFVPLSLLMPRVWRPVGLVTGIEVAAIGILGLLLLYCLDKALEIVEVGVAAPFLLAVPLWSTGLEGMHLAVDAPQSLLLGSLLIVGSLVAFWLILQRRSVVIPVVAPPRPELEETSLRSTGLSKQ